MASDLKKLVKNVLLSAHISDNPYSLKEFMNDLYLNAFENSLKGRRLTAGDMALHNFLATMAVEPFEDKKSSSLLFLNDLAYTPSVDEIIAYDLDQTGLVRKYADLLRRVELIEQYKTEVVPFEKARTETVKARILDNLSKLAVDVDRNRLEQEMIFYLEKLDITEEKVRLTNHCNYFREVASSEEGAGRKLGFIAQEMGREINTMGSKANEPNIQILVVKMKDELEKIKEQVLNIL